ncbi:hypothetical protein GIB67_016153 [Kingdonia uniflora]|uniref:Uncharacterized protein n=1 Tax=Kingdonia uniflora TaxID=39325 RepID=A0A7J7N9P6_9MAGN|nr:hypothetical protein GIB67_016153 [Kingdonia uniflora]
MLTEIAQLQNNETAMIKVATKLNRRPRRNRWMMRLLNFLRTSKKNSVQLGFQSFFTLKLVMYTSYFI